MQKFLHINFTVPAAVNSNQEVAFKKAYPGEIPPIGTTIKLIDSLEQKRWYDVRGYSQEETGATSWGEFFIDLYEHDQEAEWASCLDFLLKGEDPETIFHAQRHVEFLKINGWEQLPDLP